MADEALFQLMVDPRFSPLRNRKRVQEICRKAHLPSWVFALIARVFTVAICFSFLSYLYILV